MTSVTELPLFQSSSLNGPVPTGLLAALATESGCRMTAVFSPMRNGSIASALFSTRITVCGSGVITLEMLSNTALRALLVLSGARARSKLNLTALASKGAPSEYFTPFFSLKV